MPKTYRCVQATAFGSPDVLQVVEKALKAPAKGQVRLRILAASVSRPDITVRQGTALYAGTPLGQKIPFEPGYSIIGVVDAIGDGVEQIKLGDRYAALTVVGGYSEFVTLDQKRLIPFPDQLDPAQAVPLILNYIVAYQCLHRAAQVQAGESALIIGASGGIGTAFLQLGRLVDLQMVALASSNKHAFIAEMGAMPIDYHDQNYLSQIRAAHPDGITYIFDGMMKPEYLQDGLSLLHKGGVYVGYGEPANFGELFTFLKKMIVINLLPNGKSIKLYGTSKYTFHQKPFREDWAILFDLLVQGKIDPMIFAEFPLLEAAQANRLLESGQVVGNVVLKAWN